MDDDDADEDMINGMMSPPSGYSSPDEGVPFANAAILTAVKEQVRQLACGPLCWAWHGMVMGLLWHAWPGLLCWAWHGMVMGPLWHA